MGIDFDPFKHNKSEPDSRLEKVISARAIDKVELAKINLRKFIQGDKTSDSKKILGL